MEEVSKDFASGISPVTSWPGCSRVYIAGRRPPQAPGCHGNGHAHPPLLSRPGFPPTPTDMLINIGVSKRIQDLNWETSLMKICIAEQKHKRLQTALVS